MTNSKDITVMSSSKECLLYLFKDILDLREEDRKALGKACYWMYQKIVNMDPSNNKKLLNNKKITMVCSQELRYFCMNIDEMALSELVVMVMTPDTWHDLDINMLKVKAIL